MFSFFAKKKEDASFDELIRLIRDMGEGRFDARPREELQQVSGAPGELARALGEAMGTLKVIAETKDTALRNALEELDETKQSALSIVKDLDRERQKFKQNEALDDAILLSIGDGLVVVDTKGKILLVNKAFEQLLGWTEEELLGKVFTDAVALQNEKGEVASGKDRVISRVFATGKAITSDPHTTEYYVRKDGTTFPIAYATSPVVSDGKIVGCVEVFRDVTSEKATDKAKSEFVSLASHQLRTPLSAINWYAEMLIDGDAGELNAEQKEYLQEIYQGNQRMVDLVNALLNTSRIDLGTFAVDPAPVTLSEIAKSVVGEVRPQIMERRQTLVEDYDPAVPVISADPKLIRIIFQNFLTNAVKYTPEEGKVTISVRLVDQKKTPRSKKTEQVISISVADNGYGIPKEQQTKIFSKLFRADNVRDKVAEGNGLGLYIVKSIVEQSGGRVWFESEEGKGTTFFVTLPLTGMVGKTGDGLKALKNT